MYPRKDTIPIPQTAFQDSGGTVVYWLAGTGFLIHSHRHNILIDPVLTVKPDDPSMSEAGLPLKTNYPISAAEIPKNCYVLYTHADADHLGPETARILAGKGLTMICVPAVFERLARLGVPPEQIITLRVYESMKVGDILVESTPADHPWQLKDLARGGRPYRAGECCGYILNVPEGRMFFPGDTRLMEEHLRIPDIDLLALDVSTCEYHLNHTSAAVLANHFDHAVLLPFHYGTYDCPNVAAWCGEPEEIYAKVTNGEPRGKILAPGEEFLFM